jgi:hypothetical protein
LCCPSACHGRTHHVVNLRAQIGGVIRLQHSNKGVRYISVLSFASQLLCNKRQSSGENAGSFIGRYEIEKVKGCIYSL